MTKLTDLRGNPRLARFALLAPAAAVIGLLVVAAAILAGRTEEGALADTMRRGADVHVLALRGVVARFDYLPFAMARHPDVIALLRDPRSNSRIETVNRLLEDISDRAGSEALYLMDASGITLAASNWRQPLSFVGENYAKRPYFVDAAAGGTGRFYGVGLTSGQPGLFLSAPVTDAGNVAGVVAVKVSLRPILDTWQQLSDPVLLTDRRGIVFLSSAPEWMYKASRPIEQNDLDIIAQERQYGAGWTPSPLPWRSSGKAEATAFAVDADLAGHERQLLAIEQSLPDLGWTLTVTGDRASVDRARDRTGVISALGLALVLMGGLYWHQREQALRNQRAARAGLEHEVQKRTRELQDAQAFRKAMEDSLLVGMRARDLEGRIIYVNRALCEITGFSPEDLLGRLPPYPYWHPEDVEKHWRDNEAALSGRAALTGFESRIRHRDGHDVQTMVYTAPLIDAEGNHQGWMSSVVDITEQKRMQERQRQQEDQLHRIARIVTVGEMASTLAHELNQPLSALVNFAAAARAFAAKGDSRLLIGALDDIRLEANRAAEIVRHLRRFMRQGTDAFELLSINDTVSRAIGLLDPEVRRQRIRVEAQFSNDLPMVRGERVLLEQVIVNLLLNATQSMKSCPLDRRILEIVTDRVDGEITVVVADRGPGIDPAAANRLFDPLYTTKPQGLGLGLNICRTILESHGGRISFGARPGGGAVFTIHLKGAA